MAACRFCGSRIMQTSLPFDCPLCGQHNDADQAPVQLDWPGEGFAKPVDSCRLPFSSCLIVAPGQCALLSLDGRAAVLGEGRHPVYPADPDSARVAFVSTEWRPIQDSVTAFLSWPEAVWELHVAFALEARVINPRVLLEQSPFGGDLNARIVSLVHDALEKAMQEKLAALKPLPHEGSDALALRVDGALAGIDAGAINCPLAETGWLEVRSVSPRRELLAAEDEDGEACPVCGKKSSRAKGVNSVCRFCNARLFWCPNCRRHVPRSDDRWCPACRGRLYA